MTDKSGTRPGGSPAPADPPDGWDAAESSELRAEWAEERHPDWRAGWTPASDPAPVVDRQPDPVPVPSPPPTAEPLGPTLPPASAPTPAPASPQPVPAQAQPVPAQAQPVPAQAQPVPEPADPGVPGVPGGNPWLAALASFGRVFLVALGSAVVAVWETEPNHDLTTWTGAKWKAFAGAVTMSALLTGVNALRRGDTRFGLGWSSSRQQPR